MEADKNIRHGDCASHQPENDEGPQSDFEDRSKQSLVDEILKLREQNRALAFRAHDLKRDLEEEMEDRDAAEKEWEFERTELQKKYETEKNENDEMVSSVKAAEKRVLIIEEEMEKLRDRCATLEEQEDKKADELIREFSKQRDLYEQERSAKHAECEQLKRAVERETETTTFLRQENTRIENEVEQLLLRIKQIEKEREQDREEWVKERESLEQESKNLLDKIASMEAQMSNASSDKQKVEESVDNLQKVVKELEAELEKRTQELDETHRLHKKGEREIVRLNRQLEQLEKTRAELAQENRDLDKSVRELKREQLRSRRISSRV